MLTEDTDRRIEMLEEAMNLFSRVQEESDDVSLVKEAVSFQATCYLILNKPNEVLQLAKRYVLTFRGRSNRTGVSNAWKY